MVHPTVESWGERLLAYMRKRGYDTDSPAAILRRLFLESWAEPGFHNFWRVWNPVYGWGLQGLYRRLGGNRRPAISLMLVFVFCGFFLHDTIAMVKKGEPYVGTSIAFVLYGVATLASKRFEATLRQETWPTAVNVFVNLALAIGGTVAGIHANDLLMGWVASIIA